MRRMTAALSRKLRHIIHATHNFGVTLYASFFLSCIFASHQRYVWCGQRRGLHARSCAQATAAEVHDPLEFTIVEEVVERPDCALFVEGILAASVRAIRVHVAVSEVARLQ
jgi:hypothetical protein